MFDTLNKMYCNVIQIGIDIAISFRLSDEDTKLIKAYAKYKKRS